MSEKTSPEMMAAGAPKEQRACKDGVHYRLPLLSIGEYVLVRNLLSNCPASYWDKRHTAYVLLERLKGGTEKVLIRDGEVCMDPYIPPSRPPRHKEVDAQ